ncbi:hypothetical protein BU25DRAFT_83026 [Macroventuria anomochaeta]|uniref:Uncharacterized protein n=1 Tax=Macroventuria anomochaeta TaxID=301207 RepID=A0ACB6SGT7_9PLEO|nr:uncharacterized protein BU25DRAFT_83026 [Macroventuria anomochaeta]KAF2632800.1 hypothetical protein BU25DRAFT_83026 [Macroventuria anomochaeta]
MSLKALPTGRDERLLDYLHCRELSAMSKVPKYYRRIVEPRLYRQTHLSAARNINARWLLLTLLSRNDLTTHIKQLEVAPVMLASFHSCFIPLYSMLVMPIANVRLLRRVLERL